MFHILYGVLAVLVYLAFNITGTVYLSMFPDRGIEGADYGGSITACVLGWLGIPILNIVPPIIYSQHDDDDVSKE